MTDLLILDLTVADVIDKWPQTIPVFMKYRLGCLGCAMAPFDTLADVLNNYTLTPDSLLSELNQAVLPTKFESLNQIIGRNERDP
jgi:hybrid cluster-associated redox disulfide protein